MPQDVVQQLSQKLDSLRIELSALQARFDQAVAENEKLRREIVRLRSEAQHAREQSRALKEAP